MYVFKKGSFQEQRSLINHMVLNFPPRPPSHSHKMSELSAVKARLKVRSQIDNEAAGSTSNCVED